MGVVTHSGQLQAIDFLADNIPSIPPKDSLSVEVVSQLEAYCRDSQFCFDLPLVVAKTEYQQQVRKALLKISVGEVLSYAALASELDSGARAIAMACRHNPLPVIVPCHRIVAKNGMGGYSGTINGKPIEIKSWLLKHEHCSKS